MELFLSVEDAINITARIRRVQNGRENIITSLYSLLMILYHKNSESNALLTGYHKKSRECLELHIR